MANYHMDGESLIGRNSMGEFFLFPVERNSFVLEENANVLSPDPILKSSSDFSVDDFQFDSLLNEELGQDFFSNIDEAISGTISMHSSNVFSNNISTCNLKSMLLPLSPSDSGVGSPNINLPLSGPDLYATRSSENSDFVVSHKIPSASISAELSHPVRDDCKIDNLDVLLLNQPDLSLHSTIDKKDCIDGKFDEIFESNNMSCFDYITRPLSPSDTFDSGVESPGMDLSAFSPDSNLDQPLEIIDYSDLHDIFSNDDTYVLSESFVRDDTLVNFELLPSEKLLPNCVTTKALSNDSNQLSKVEMHLPKPLSLVEPVLLGVSEPKSGIKANTETFQSTPRSRCRKSKITSLEEKKQRKRDQNKNAATRYREKKRQEAEEKAVLYNSLNTRNKELNNQVLQMSREINYLKDLMIEVYRIKGVIPKSN